VLITLFLNIVECTYDVSFTYCNKSRCLDVLCNQVSQVFKTLKLHVKSVRLFVNCEFLEQWIIHMLKV
jgi:hypothetical protein